MTHRVWYDESVMNHDVPKTNRWEAAVRLVGRDLHFDGTVDYLLDY